MSNKSVKTKRGLVSKGSEQAPAAKKRADVIEVAAAAGADPDALIAQAILRPNVKAALAATWFSKSIYGQSAPDISALVNELSNQSKAVIGGDMTRPEAMLVAQAHTLDAIFLEMARRAALNMSEYIDATDTYLRLALRAQSQCRATLETLSVIKNPQASVAFVKQANIAHGPQQVNNGVSPPVRAGARENDIEQSKLLEASNGERMDIGTPTSACGIDSSLEAVGTVNGTADDNR